MRADYFGLYTFASCNVVHGITDIVGTGLKHQCFHEIMELYCERCEFISFVKMRLPGVTCDAFSNSCKVNKLFFSVFAAMRQLG